MVAYAQGMYALCGWILSEIFPDNCKDLDLTRTRGAAHLSSETSSKSTFLKRTLQLVLVSRKLDE